METEKNIKILKNSFLTFSVFSVITGVFFVVYLLINGHIIMKNSILNIISENTFLGTKLTEFIFNQASNFNLLDFPLIYAKYLENLIIIEALLSLVPIIIVQVLFTILSRRTVKKDTAFFSAFFIITILLVIILNMGNYFSVLEYFDVQALKTKNIIISLISIGQLTVFIMLLRKLAKAQRFRFSKLKEKTVYNSIIKAGSIFVIIFFLGVSLILTVANQNVEKIKEDLKVDYTISIKEQAEGVNLIEIPDKLQKDGAKYGINLPATINAADVLTGFHIEKIDIGKYINKFMSEKIDNIKYRVINIPLLQSIIVIFATIIIGIISLLQRKGILDYQIFSVIQGAMALIMLIYIGDKFTFLPQVFLGLILIGTVLKSMNYIDFRRWQKR